MKNKKILSDIVTSLNKFFYIVYRTSKNCQKKREEKKCQVYLSVPGALLNIKKTTLAIVVTCPCFYNNDQGGSVIAAAHQEREQIFENILVLM